MIKASVEMEAVEVELKGRIVNFAAETACLICAVYSAIYEQNREEAKCRRYIGWLVDKIEEGEYGS